MPIWFDTPDGRPLPPMPAEDADPRPELEQAQEARADEFVRVMRATDWRLDRANVEHALTMAHKAYTAKFRELGWA